MADPHRAAGVISLLRTRAFGGFACIVWLGCDSVWRSVLNFDKTAFDIAIAMQTTTVMNKVFQKSNESGALILGEQLGELNILDFPVNGDLQIGYE